MLNSEETFAVVFAAMGIPLRKPTFYQRFSQYGAIDRAVMFINLANDPAIERTAPHGDDGRIFGIDLDMHVLVLVTDITYYEALREVSAARKEVPGRRGYQLYRHTVFMSVPGRIRKERIHHIRSDPDDAG